MPKVPETDVKPVATKEMIQYWAELQEKSQEKVHENNHRAYLHARRKKLLEEVAEATVGYGLALKALTEKKIEVEKEIEGNPINTYFDMQMEFRKKFGLDPYQLNMYPKPTQADLQERSPTNSDN